LFTGIVKTTSSIKKVTQIKEELKIFIEKKDFPILATGDSVAVDGACLTLEKLLPDTMQFHLSYETLKVTGWNKENIHQKKVNLEPALKVGDFIGGHFVTGHLDTMAKVIKLEPKGESRLMEIEFPSRLKPFFWPKAFVTLNGVSLTVNKVINNRLCLCLVPETLSRTNLLDQKPGSRLSLEIDSTSRALVSSLTYFYNNPPKKFTAY